MISRDQDFTGLVRAIVSSRQQATKLSCPFLADLLAMAALEAALQWIGGHATLTNDNERLETLLKTKLQIALAEGESSIFPINTKTDN